MKKIYHILLIMLAMSFGLIACTEETPFSTATENDDPRILDPLFPDQVNGELPVVSNISRDANFSMTLTVTPADYTTVTWFIDGEEIQTGKGIGPRSESRNLSFESDRYNQHRQIDLP